ncbi:type IV pilin [Halohasta salina]|uniref:type IV pilin n=1 Tax=Halohasta salina TaxID=2961621 RepID=UPI0020A3F805|nr:type IV pilin N-terminal domain-containing protein [Halohasta salina]
MGERGISPVVGVVLMVAITLLLASVFTVLAGGFAGFGSEKEQINDLLGTNPWENSSNEALVPANAPGEPPRTSGEDILEFRIENTGTEQVTVDAFAVDASGIESGMTVDDANADEFEIRRTNQLGAANRAGSPDAFDATGVRYELVDDSTDGGQVAEINAGTDDAEVDIRRFSHDVGDFVISDDPSSPDLTVTLELASGAEERFYFETR